MCKIIWNNYSDYQLVFVEWGFQIVDKYVEGTEYVWEGHADGPEHDASFPYYLCLRNVTSQSSMEKDWQTFFLSEKSINVIHLIE